MKYIIIGAVAGGASTAARLRRLDENAEIILIEKGEYISYANCGLPYYIGDVIKERNKLFIQTANSFNERFNIDVRPFTEALNINTKEKNVQLLNSSTGKKYSEHYDKLILAPGAIPIVPPLNGIDLQGIFTIRNVKDTDLIKAAIQQTTMRHATVIGAGFIGLEMIENLHHLGLEVTLIERANQVLPPVDFPIAAILQNELVERGIDLKLNSTVVGFSNTENNRINVEIQNLPAIETDIVILSIGVKPNSKLAVEANLKIGDFGGVLVNEFMQTSNPSVYAVGNAIEFEHPITKKSSPSFLAGPANKQGRICANNIVFGNTSSYHGSINTAIVKVFSYTIAAAGLSVKQLIANNIPHIVSTTFGGSHAGYYPGSEQLAIQLAFSPTSGVLLGAQVAGKKGVDKRIDILSLLIQQKGTVADLCEFEHAYAPPFSSAKDPINMAGFAAENMLNDMVEVYCWDNITDFSKDEFLVDVRTSIEFKKGNISSAINIPLDSIRERLNEFPKNQRISIYCQAGLRGYLAQRILSQNGFQVRNLSGGYRLWKECSDALNATKQLEKT
jgi:NADPH-dependent 2,4-dienoyl-CoA reductase/sulfur reductase-like enzyme/rhodanese-related sulfurtransferase